MGRWTTHMLETLPAGEVVGMGADIDGLLVQWGERLFYPRNRIVKPDYTPRLRADVIRRRIVAVVRRAPQVIVRATGGGKGMGAIAAHLRYITHGGELQFEDDRGTVRAGSDALRDVLDQWRHGGGFIAPVSHRREALNIVLAMRAGTDPDRVKQAVREFARIELSGHRYVMVLHRHQTSPHVHLCVKLESSTGERLHPGEPGLKRWRETFAEKLQELGVAADATPQWVRGGLRNFELPWRLKANEQGRLRHPVDPARSGKAYLTKCKDATVSWAHIIKALTQSDQESDVKLADEVARFITSTPFVKKSGFEKVRTTRSDVERSPAVEVRTARHEVPGPERVR
jgi:hypothetical protein